MKNPDPLERDIEKAVVAFAKTRNVLAYKFTSPSCRSVPDRLFIMPGAKGCFLIEFKRKGQKPTLAQEVEIAKIRKQGIYVGVIDRVDEGKKLVERMLSDDGMF